MKVFRELIVYIPEETLERFISRVSAELTDGWSRDHEAESKVVDTNNDRFLFFICEKKEDREAALVALAQRDRNIWYVSNIVPRETDRLSFDQYNYILEEFYDRYISPVADRMGLNVEISSDKQSIDDWLSPESAAKLRKFSVAANRATGSSHPKDEERWFDFLLSTVYHNDNFDTTRLSRWLVEEGWAPDIAHELAEEYEKGIRLLKFERNHQVANL